MGRVFVVAMAIFVVVNVTGQRPFPVVSGHALASTGHSQIALPFEENMGQADASVQYLAHRGGLGVLVKRDEVVVSTQDPSLVGNLGARSLRLRFPGAKPASTVYGENQLPGVVNYYLGQDRNRWHTGIATYARVTYANLYPGIDLSLYGAGDWLEHDYIVAPGADPSAIAVDAVGARALSISTSGDLDIELSAGIARLHAPVIYQIFGGRRVQVDGGFTLRGPRQFGYWVAGYDASRPLVIDPVLSFSTYMGGDRDDYAYALAVDPDGNTYITGATNSSDYPIVDATQDGFGAGGVGCPTDVVPYRYCYDAFVTKINPHGNAILYSTYLGDQGDDQSYGIAVGSDGSAYITGQLSMNSSQAPDLWVYKYAFAAKLSPTGTLAYLGYFNPPGSIGRAIAVDQAGRAYITGEASGDNLPVTANAIQAEREELIDAFVSVIAADGSGFEYSTYLGGDGTYCGECYSTGNAIAVDANGLIYITGQAAPSFPTTANAYQRAFDGFWKVFVAKIDPMKSGASGLLYSTYIGGAGSDFGKGIALDDEGAVYVTGATQSENFPTTPGAYDRTCGTDGLCNALSVIVCDPVPPGLPPHCHTDNRSDVFVAKFDLTKAGAAGLVFSTYLGGAGKDRANAIAVDANHDVYIAGATFSTDYPTAQPVQSQSGGNIDAFVTKLDATGSSLDYSTYLGGGGDDEAFGIGVDSALRAVVTGYTGSAAFPVANPLRQRAGGWEAFIARLGSIRTFVPSLARGA